MTEDLAVVLVTFMVIGVPVLGLTARFALKPIVESILRMREAFMQDQLADRVRPEELERLEAEVDELRREVRRLNEAAEFDRKLLGDAE